MKTTFLQIFFFFAFTQLVIAEIEPVKLTCEYLSNPSVIDVKTPRLGWVNVSKNNERGQKQTAYQIRVASSENQLFEPDFWDSGKIISNESTRVKYAGNILQSEQECWWQVRVWGKDNKVSAWSKPA